MRIKPRMAAADDWLLAGWIRNDQSILGARLTGRLDGLAWTNPTISLSSV